MGRDYKTIDLDKISETEVKINMISKAYNVGTVRFFSGRIKKDDDGTSKVFDSWLAIADPYDVFKLVKQTSSEYKKRA